MRCMGMGVLSELEHWACKVHLDLYHGSLARALNLPLPVMC
jgi:hypothetical protein